MGMQQQSLENTEIVKISRILAKSIYLNDKHIYL